MVKTKTTLFCWKTVMPHSSPGKFIPVPLHKWERVLYRSFWISHSLIAFVIAYFTTQGEVLPWIQHWLRPSSYVSNAQIDISDTEWVFYKKNVFRLFLCYTLHSLTLCAYYRSPNKTKTLQYCVWAVQIALHVLMCSWFCVFTCALLALGVICVTVYYRTQWIAWVVCIGFVLQCAYLAPFTNNSFIYYLEFNLYAYSCLKILNVCIFLSRNSSMPCDSSLRSSILQYLMYLPYSITLIVIFEDFRAQIDQKEREIEKTGTKYIHMTIRDLCKQSIRLIVWFLFLDTLYHFIYASALFASPFTLINGMNSYQLMSIAYVVGQCFQVKYVVIFGMPALYAMIDGMRPPPPPICVSRVSRYSRMWRHFDAGLYEFLKNQVYVPLLRGSSGLAAILLRLLAIVCVFLIVLVWHGFDSHYVCWVSLSAFELLVEWAGRSIWDTSSFQILRKRLGEKGTRRIIALGMLATVIPGIFGVFCFLGRAGIGTTIIKKVIYDGFVEIMSLPYDGWPSTGLMFLHMLVLGYFFNNYTLELDEKQICEREHSNKNK